MLPELQPHLDKILGRFSGTESDLKLLAAHYVSIQVTTRQAHRIRAEAQLRLTELLDSTQPTVAAFLRLNYVRSARKELPEFRMGSGHEAWVEQLAKHAHSLLITASERSLGDFHRLARLSAAASTAQVMYETAATQPLLNVLRANTVGTVVDRMGNRWGLEQYAGVTLRSTGERAVLGGRQAGTEAHYAGAQPS